MREKKRIDQVIVVEGRHDKAKLSKYVDAVIIQTDGYRIFKDEAKLAFLKLAAKERGLLIMTDSDPAGFRIRAHLKRMIREGSVWHAYIPTVYSECAQSSNPRAVNQLGVEHMAFQALMHAIEQSGIQESEPVCISITREDFFSDGLLGGSFSKQLRNRLASRLSLPQNMSTTAMLDAINIVLTLDEYKSMITELHFAVEAEKSSG